VAAGATRLNRQSASSPHVEDEESPERDEREARGIVRLEFFAQIEDGENREDRKRDYFLNGLELRTVEFVGADAVRGTWKQYSKKAITQLTRMTFQSASLRNFRWPFHAKVIKMLEMVRNRIVRMRKGAPPMEL
jgi:hypothetical protein